MRGPRCLCQFASAWCKAAAPPTPPTSARADGRGLGDTHARRGPGRGASHDVGHTQPFLFPPPYACLSAIRGLSFPFPFSHDMSAIRGHSFFQLHCLLLSFFFPCSGHPRLSFRRALPCKCGRCRHHAARPAQEPSRRAQTLPNAASRCCCRCCRRRCRCRRRWW